MKPRPIVIGLLVIAVLVAAAWWRFGRSSAATDVPAEDNASVLVRTEPVRREELPLNMNVFGEVVTGTPEALSFPQAGQLTRLAVVAGQQVRRGEPLASLSSDPAARSSYLQAANAVEFAQRELRRNQDLLALQLATQSQLDAARNKLLDAQAALAAQTRLGGAQATAQLAAPFDGVVTALPVSQGDRVAAGATVLQLGRTGRLRVLLAIEPAQSARIAAGMPVTITPVQDEANALRASITEVEKLVDPKTQMVNAVVVLPDAGKLRLLSGMRVQAVIELGRRQAWVVPRQAVLSDDKSAYLFQVKNQRALRVDVSKLVETPQLYGVEGKLDAGLPAVVLGNYELHDGMSVREEAR